MNKIQSHKIKRIINNKIKIIVHFNLKIDFLLEEIHKIKKICIYKIKYKTIYKISKLTKDIVLFKMKVSTEI